MKATGTVQVLPSFWAVGPKCPCLQITPIRYTDTAGAQLALQIDSINRPSIFFMSPLLIKVVDQLSIGTDAREPALHEAMEEVGYLFRGSSAVGSFTSGPLTALFPHERYESARECYRNECSEPKSEVASKSVELPFSRFFGLVFAKNNMVRHRLPWELCTMKVLEALKSYGLPFLRFRTYFEAGERCGLDPCDLHG